MKKLIIMVSLVAVLLMVASSVFAYQYTVNVSRTDGEYWGSGGEFDVTLTGANGTYTFDSFCLEMDEYMGGTLANISSGAIGGGLSGGNPDPISIGTAYLYSEFISGSLAGYVYTNSGTAASAGALQNAIWWLEGELLSKPISNFYIGLVEGLFTDPTLDANGAYNVSVLNIYSVSGTPKQDMLVSVPEPGLLILLGLGFVGIGILRKKS